MTEAKAVSVAPPAEQASAKALIGARIAALVLDRVVVALVLMPAAAFTTSMHEEHPGVRAAFAWVLFLLLVLLVGAYSFSRDAFRGRSLGRWVFGLRVVDERTGQPIGPLQSFKRELCLHVMPLLVLEVILLCARNDGRRLGDRWAGTIVVATPDRMRDAIRAWLNGPGS